MPARRLLSFPKRRRLAGALEFERVRRQGRALHGRLLTLGVLKAQEPGSFRAGFVVSRRIGGAVVRNRVRRRLREIVRNHQHEISDGSWVVTVARANAARATYRQLEDEWLRMAKRASLWQADKYG